MNIATIGLGSFSRKAKAYVELAKLRLSGLVAFSSAFGYLLANQGHLDWIGFMFFLTGGFLISVASVTLNQIIEENYDAMMSRTKNRPLPTSRLSKYEASCFAVICLPAGSSLVYFNTNLLTLMLALLSFVLYVYVYTPLKRVGPVAVFAGAFPGALPPLIGWVAATGNISHETLILFGIQFIWQFPHFWAIAWIADEDYKKAGFKLLPGGGGKDLNTAINIMTYTLFLLPLGLLPSYFGLTGITSGVVATLCGVLFLSQTFLLMKDASTKSALKIMFVSIIYLPIVQITYLMDKM